MAATAPAATPPLDALLNTLASTCPEAVSAGEAGPTLQLSPLGRSVFDAAVRAALARLAADAADAGAPLMEHAPVGGGGAPAAAGTARGAAGRGPAAARGRGRVGRWETEAGK